MIEDWATFQCKAKKLLWGRAAAPSVVPTIPTIPTILAVLAVLAILAMSGCVAPSAMAQEQNAANSTNAFQAGGEGQTPAVTSKEFQRDVLNPGGRHELGAWVGFSLHSGHYLGYAKNVKWFPVNVKYSYRFWTHDTFALRYAPEVTVLALLDEPDSNFAPNSSERRRTVGGGLTPAGFEMNFYPKSRVQPFLSEHSGLDYFAQRVLSPEGSQLLFETDLGLGINFFTKKRQDVTVGYRYQHLSNANISNRNPGTDANTFYVGFSRFWTKGVR